MIKSSYYNHLVQINDSAYLLYNSFTCSFSVVSKKIYSLLKQDNIDNQLWDSDYISDEWKSKLKDIGAVVDSNLDEVNIVKQIRLQRRYSSRIYELTINPSMDCNLSCWYCYENHISKSNMTLETAKKIIDHITLHHKTTNFQALKLNLFGGEPLLNSKATIFIIDKCDEFCLLNNIQFEIFITTNGTCLTESMLHKLSKHNIKFQITLDGAENRHNSVRFTKNTKKSTYRKIIKTFELISAIFSNYHLRIRVNIENDTLSELNTILTDIDFLDRDKVSIGIHQIWQVDDSTMNYTTLYEFINKANENNFLVSYNPLDRPLSYICYADNYNQAVINYNGDIFKCTARDFTTANREGILLENGEIKWDVDKLIQRMSVRTPDICEKCKFLPSCFGVCSQKILEKNIKCSMSTNQSPEDMILLNFKQQFLKNEK